MCGGGGGGQSDGVCNKEGGPPFILDGGSISARLAKKLSTHHVLVEC